MSPAPSWRIQKSGAWSTTFIDLWIKTLTCSTSDQLRKMNSDQKDTSMKKFMVPKERLLNRVNVRMDISICTGTALFNREIYLIKVLPWAWYLPRGTRSFYSTRIHTCIVICVVVNFGICLLSKLFVSSASNTSILYLVLADLKTRLNNKKDEIKQSWNLTYIICLYLLASLVSNLVYKTPTQSLNTIIS